MPSYHPGLEDRFGLHFRGEIGKFRFDYLPHKQLKEFYKQIPIYHYQRVQCMNGISLEDLRSHKVGGIDRSSLAC